MNREQFEEYVEKHRPYLLRVVTARVNSPEAAEDIVQTALEYLWRIAPGLHADDDPKPLFWKAVHWELGKFYRKKPKVELVPLDEVEDELHTRDGIECLEVGIDFDRALVPFNDREREVLVKVLSEDWTTREIAAVYKERGQSNWSRWLKYKAHPRLREVVFEGAAA